MPEYGERSEFKEEYYEVVWTGNEVQQFLETTGINFAEFEQAMGRDLLGDLRIINVASIRVRVDKHDLKIYRIEFELDSHIVSVGFSKEYPDSPFYRVVFEVNPIKKYRIYLEAKTRKTSQAEYVRNLLRCLNDSDLGKSVVEEIRASWI